MDGRSGNHVGDGRSLLDDLDSNSMTDIETKLQSWRELVKKANGAPIAASEESLYRWARERDRMALSLAFALFEATEMVAKLSRERAP